MKSIENFLMESCLSGIQFQWQTVQSPGFSNSTIEKIRNDTFIPAGKLFPTFRSEKTSRRLTVEFNLNTTFAELHIIIVRFWISINHAAGVTRPLQSHVLTSAAPDACRITAIHTLAVTFVSFSTASLFGALEPL